MVKPGPDSKKKEIMLEILNLLSEKPHGFREVHRNLPESHRAGSFATLNACTNLLKSEGYIEEDQETKKLRITTNGAIERRKRLVINEINEAKIVAGCTSLSDTSPVLFEWILAKHLGDAPQSINRLREILQVAPPKASLSILSHFLWYILKNCDNDGSASQKQTLDDARRRLSNELPADVEVLNIFSIDTGRLLTWLETPSGVATLEYVLEQKREGGEENIERLLNGSFSTQTQTLPPYGYRIAQGKTEDTGKVENGENA
jgi:hypothetical protein